MSAKIKILLLIGLLFSSVIFIISGIAFNNFESVSVKNNTTRIDTQAFLMSKAIEQKMSRYFDVLNVTADITEIDENGLLDINEMLLYLNSLAKRSDIIEAYITTKDAKTYSSAQNGLIPNLSTREQEWFIRAMNNEEHIVTTPYKNNQGVEVVTIAVPIERDGLILGVLSVNIGVNNITEYINELTPKNQLFVSRNDGYLFAAQDLNMIGDNLYNLRPSFKAFQNESRSLHHYNLKGKEYVVASSRIESLEWTVWSWAAWSDIEEASYANLQTTLLVAFVFILLALYSVYIIIMKLMYRPIGGEPKDIEAIVQKIAQGDLRSVASATGKETGIYKALLVMVNSLKDIVERINTSTAQLNTSSIKMSDSASSVNSSSESQMMQLEQTSTAMNEMTVTVDEVARYALQASTAADEANNHSNLGIKVVNEMNADVSTLVNGITNVQAVIGKLGEEINTISSIIEVIRGISEQTNLLALNAAIEAARAGEQGRGFAVVADEVRSLANRTQESTTEIQSMIDSLQAESKNSVGLMQINVDNAQLTVEKSHETNSALEEIRQSVSVIQDMNKQISTAAEEQTLVAGEINESLVNINDGAKATLQTSEENTKTAGELLTIAKSLNESVEIFKL